MVDEAIRKQTQMEIELTGLRKEKDDASKERTAKLEKELAEVREKVTALQARWEAEKGGIAKVQELKAAMELARTEMARAEREGNYAKASELKYSTLLSLETQLKETEAQLQKTQGDRLLKEEVDEEDIADIISRWTHIPVAKLIQGEREKLLHLEDEPPPRDRPG